MTQKYIVQFSCGVPSAVAVMLAFREFGREVVKVMYCDTGSEHPDNERFMKDVENWLGFKTVILKSEKYTSVKDVIDSTRWIAGIGGARCTGELKRIPSEAAINYGRDQEIEILGYTIEEEARVANWIDNNRERKIYPILIKNQLSKTDCQGIIAAAGIRRPTMYDLGYQNNNCIGCVKGGGGYWNKIRRDFPSTFKERAAQERDIGACINKVQSSRKTSNGMFIWPEWVQGLTNYHKLNKKTGLEQWETGRIAMYLDEMPEDYGDYPSEQEVQCGIFLLNGSGIE